MTTNFALNAILNANENLDTISEGATFETTLTGTLFAVAQAELSIALSQQTANRIQLLKYYEAKGDEDSALVQLKLIEADLETLDE